MARGNKNAVIAVVIIVVILGGAWFAYHAGYFLRAH